MTQHPAKNVNGPIRKFSVPKEFCSTEFLKSTICDRNQCKCMGRTEQIEKEEHTTAEINLIATKKYLYRIVFQSFGVQLARGALLDSKKFFGRKNISAWLFNACLGSSWLPKRFVSRHCSLPADRHTEQNRSAKRKQFSRKSSSLDNPHSRYSNKTLFSQPHHQSIVEGRFIVLVSLVLFCHRPWPWPPWRKNFLEFVLVHVSAVDSWLIPFSGRKQRENSSARSNWFVPRKHR